MGIFMVFIGLVVAGDQPIHAIGACRPTRFKVGNGDGNGDKIRVRSPTLASGQLHLIEGDGAGEVAEALGDVVGGAEDAIGAGEDQAFHSARASDARVWSGAVRVIGRADDAIVSGAKEWLGSGLKDSGRGSGSVVDRCERKLLAVAGRVDAFHGIEGFVAGDQVFLRRSGGSDGGGETCHYGEQADGHDHDRNHDFEQRETALR